MGLLRYFGRREWILSAIAVCFIITQVYLDVKIPGYMEAITLDLEMGSTEALKQDGILMVGCAVASLAFALMNNYLITNISTSVSFRLRELQFSKAISMPKKDADRFTPASLMTRGTNDVNQVQQFVYRGFVVLIQAPITAVWAAYKILEKNVEWTYATVLAVVALTILLSLTVAFTIKRYTVIQTIIDRINSVSRENAVGVRTIRAYSAEKARQKAFDAHNDELYATDKSIQKAVSVVFPASTSVSNFLTMAIYGIGAVLIMHTADTYEQMNLFADMIVFSSYALLIVSSFMMLSGMVRLIPRSLASFKRIAEVLEKEPEEKNGEGSPESCGIAFDHVSFTYPGSAVETLSDVSFSASPGETLAIIGPTGCGKTAVVNLIMGFYPPDSGSVMMGGRDIREYDMDEYRKHLGYAPQNAVLFDTTVRENVNYGYGAENRSDEEIWSAIRTAQAEGFVKSMGGLDADISQYGRNLSGGQKQRLSVARAVCRRPDVYVLDDCFSALDYETDKNLRLALQKESKDQVRVIVAQRIGTVRDADTILVLEEGRMAGIGTHDELMENCPEYRMIARSQNIGGGERRATFGTP